METPLPELPADCREVLEVKNPGLLADVDEVMQSVTMFGKTTQTTVDEAKRRIEAMTPQMTPAPKGESVNSAKLGQAMQVREALKTGLGAVFTPKDPGTYRVSYASAPGGPNDINVSPPPGEIPTPPWTRHLKKKHRREMRDLLARMADGTAVGRDEDRIIKLEAKAHKRAKKRTT